MNKSIWMIILGGVLLALGLFALKTGKVLSKHGWVHRDEKPVFFWILTVINLVAGGIFLLAGLAVRFIF